MRTRYDRVLKDNQRDTHFIQTTYINKLPNNNNNMKSSNSNVTGRENRSTSVETNY